MNNKDYQNIIEQFMGQLEHEISTQSDEHLNAYLERMREKGTLADNDFVLLEGYFKGLKVAREMMIHQLSVYAESIENGVINDADYAKFVDALFSETTEN